MSGRSPGLVMIALLAAVALAATSGVAVADTAPGANESVAIDGVYPNPVTDGDAGEFVVLEADGPTSLDGFTVTDDAGAVALPNRIVDGRVALSTHPNLTGNRTDIPVLGVASPLRLANDGDRVELRREGRTVDALAYADAPEGELGTVTDDGLTWAPLAATEYPVVTAAATEVRTFVLPDGAGVPAETLGAADDRILLAGYTFTSRRVADALVAASDRGVDVAVLVDGSPVGGLTRREAVVLDRLAARGVAVTVLVSEPARYRYHHAKYAVVDDRALVTTENWKPAGTGGRSSRGWGVVVDDGAVVDALVETFRADAGWRDGVRWSEYRDGRTFESARSPPANGTYPTRFPPERARADRVELLRAPDNAEGRVVALLDGATESIRIEQVSVGGRRQPFLRAALRAARRGVDVQILLGGAWYVREDNRALAAWLNERARREGLPLEARVADPNGRFEKIHAKGVVVDGERALVGSINWNNNSVRENREVALLLHGEEVAGYYAGVFRADWRGGVWTLPVGVVVAVALGAVGAAVVARRVSFESEHATPGASDR